jgi:cytochrome c peroxidase
MATKNIKEIKGYKAFFVKAFGNEEVTEDKITKAIATFERSIVSPPSKFDKFVTGEKDALTDSEINGLHLFRTKANCINCHNTPYFSDQKFHNLGLTYYGNKYEDLGRYMATKKNEDVGKFKTPTLREVSENKPYMHNGLFPELVNVVMMYNAGMVKEIPKADQINDPKFPHKSGMIEKLNLTDDEVFDIVAFLKTLNSYEYKMRPPELPE